MRCAGGAAQVRGSTGAGPAGPRAGEGRGVEPGKKVWAGFLGPGFGFEFWFSFSISTSISYFYF